MRFIGNIEAKADSKGRLFIPALFRKLLEENSEEQVVLSKNLYQPCLVLYPRSIWDAELEELKDKLNKWDPQHQLILRQYVSDIELITIDSNGRILIPKRYLQAVNIETEIRFIGMDEKIEIWAKELTNDPFMPPKEFSSALYQIMENKNE